MNNFHVFSRRTFLDRSFKAGLGVALATLTDIPFVMKRALAEGSIGLNGKKVLFIWLRFGNDGLNNIIPIEDSAYAGIRQNIGISLVVKVVALALTLVGITTLWMAVAVDLGTSLLVTANALRLTRWQLPGSGHGHAEPVQAGTGLPAGEATGLATGDA